MPRGAYKVERDAGDEPQKMWMQQCGMCVALMHAACNEVQITKGI